MNKWFKSFMLEIRMIFTQPLFLLLPILFGIWFAFDLSAISPPRSEDLYHFAYDFHKVKQTLSLGVAVFLGMHMVRRDLKKPSYDWLGSLPVSSATLLTAKYAAGVLYLTLFTLAMSMVYAAFALMRRMTLPEIGTYLTFFGLQYEWSYGVTLALAMSLAVFIKGRVAYLIGFNAWMFGTFFMDIFIVSQNDLYPLKTFHLNQFFRHSPLEQEVWGMRLAQKEIWFSRLFVAAFILLLMVLMIAVLKGIRPSRTYRWWIGLSAASFILALAAFLPYGLLWQERYQAFAEKAKDAAAMGTRGVVHRFPIRSYEIDLMVNPQGELSVSASMEIPKEEVEKSPLPFTLNPIFHVTEAFADGQAVPFSQEGDLVRVNPSTHSPPSDPVRITLRYTGKAIDWNYDSGLYDYFHAFVDEKTVYLRAEAGWYPLAGETGLYHISSGSGKEKLFLNNHLPTHASQFTVRIYGVKNKVYSTLPEGKTRDPESNQDDQNHFAGEANAVSLYSGDLTEVKLPQESTVVITSPSNRLEAERYLLRFTEMKRYYTGWLEKPLNPLQRIFYFSPLGNPQNFFEEPGPDYYLIAESTFHNLDERQLVNAVNKLLFNDIEPRTFFSEEPSDVTNHSIASEIRFAFYYLYGRDALHLTRQEAMDSIRMPPDSEEKRFPTPIYNPERHPVLNPILEEIDRAIDAGKTEQVKKVLNHFRSKGLTRMDDESHEPLYPRITLEDWHAVWKQVFANPMSGR
ncbi:ABC transporter permease [Thermicanus aegyptius]|uniref:ABC transporter permease n=1 Tax=Thermicanus aegyptius TaxID=94009 RepID=UPI0004919B9D|nr:ABC transporter permease [Thermicanus aegyptius]